MVSEKHWQTLYYLKNNPVKHHSKCQSRICVDQRTNTRIPPKEIYTSGRFGVCNDCETPYPSELLRCPCCSHILRKKSKYRKSREPDTVRY